MNWKDFQTFYRIIEQDNLSLFYRGEFADEITVRIIDISDVHFGESSSMGGMRKKVAFLMAECFQNVIRHGDVNPISEGLPEHAGYFMTRNISGNFYIASGNLIANEHIPGLQSKIDNINKLDREELKNLYMKVLGTDEVSSKGGAGLGLIEMARKSGREIAVDFREINEKLTFFYIQILIEGSADTITEQGNVNRIDQSVALNEILKKNNILMAYQGDFRQDSILPLLNMIDQNLNAKMRGTQVVNKTLFHILVETLQNIMHHGYVTGERREGVFSVGISEHKYNLTAANFVDNEKVTGFKKMIDEFLAMNSNELKEAYKKILKHGPHSPGGGAGLGFIDIIRASSKTPEYKLVKLDDKKTLFYLNVLL